MKNLLRKFGQWLRNLEDPRYRTQPLVLPRAWHGSGRGGLTADQLARFNVRDMGHDPAMLSQQPLNKLFNAMNRQRGPQGPA